MTSIWIRTVCVAIILTVTGCGAKARSGTCAPLGAGDGTAVRLAEPLDEPTRLGLAGAIQVGAGMEEFKGWYAGADKAKGDCLAGHVALPDGSTTPIHGGTSEQPLRWAWVNDERSVMLVHAPTIPDAHRLLTAAKGADIQRNGSNYLLLSTYQDMWSVMRIYAAPPSEAALARAFAEALDPGADPTAVMHLDSLTVTVLADTRSGKDVVFVGEPTVDNLFATFLTPDGEYFTATDGAVRMSNSGLLCPVSLGRLPLGQLHILEKTDAGWTLGCQYLSEDSQVIVVTHPADHEGPQAHADTEVEAQKPGSAKMASSPLALGGEGRPTHGAFWTNEDTSTQGIWVAQIGGWIVETQVHFREADREAVLEAARLVFRQAHETLGGT